MQTRALRLCAAFGCIAQLVVACGGQASESHSTNAGSSGFGESAGSGNSAGVGAVGASAGTSPGGSAGSVAFAGAGGAIAREPVKHRASATTCDHVRATTDPHVPPPTDGDETYVLCRSHADCTEGENGRCVGNGHDGWRCTYDDCFADADCPGADGKRALCECEGLGVVSSGNACLDVECRVDGDCGAGGYCSPSLGACGNYFGIAGYFCHTKQDECLDDADCNPDGSTSGVGYCAFMQTTGRWQCSTAQCVG